MNTYSTGTLVSVTATFLNAGTPYNPTPLYGAYVVRPFNPNLPMTAPVVSLFNAGGQPFSIVQTTTGIFILEIPTPIPGIYYVSASDEVPSNFTGIFRQYHIFQAKTPPV